MVGFLSQTHRQISVEHTKITLLAKYFWADGVFTLSLTSNMLGKYYEPTFWRSLLWAVFQN